MPLKHGKSAKTFKSNVGELVKTFKESGKIGSSHPKSLAKATKQAVAIAYSEKRKALSGDQKKRRLKVLG